ncbi:hypothetical protein K488DRAFT_85149 [Vararia minispora EC-137]|uniref:Uncharacterized protein n=1 Tax=Vararia minispora EC-137 TaxID=1314806 RepID=A0ACB8QP45_9AGAM|nr:hypothetical protein K488DRAFT_85149 [Vararia minispora EC-137]
MAPSRILPYHVQLILQYIVPPSELENPIPSHLLSRTLLQRHVFLEIQPADPSYLTWDAASRDRAVALLETVHKPFDGLENHLDVAYLADGESTFAHVHLRCLGADGLRAIFEWEESDSSWRFHDIGLMPFPPTTHSTLDGALSSIGMLEVSPDYPDSPRSPSAEADDDTYWNSYGAPDGEDTEPILHATSADKATPDNEEDAYWAQYSSVQGAVNYCRSRRLLEMLPLMSAGTADSTIPTPPHHRLVRKLVPAPEEPLPIPAATMIRPRNGPREPPSPATLAQRLGQLDLGSWTIRPVSAPRSPPDCNFDEMVSQHTETEGGSQDDDSVARSLLSASEQASSSQSSDGCGVESDRDGSGPPKPMSPFLLRAKPTDDGERKSGSCRPAVTALGGLEDDGVREVIRGAYRLWRAVHAGQGTQQDFAHLVFDVIDGL